MSNRVQKINSHHGVMWCYVPTAENPANLVGHGGHQEEADQWWNGPSGLQAKRVGGQVSWTNRLKRAKLKLN